jgi:hypothetical protein
MSSQVVVAFITGVLGPVSLLLIKYYLDKRKVKPDIVKDALQVSELVNSKIDVIRDEFKADRIWITQFHNGGNFYPTGKSMAKFTMMYETVNGSVTSIQNNFQNIPVNLFSKSINQLLEEDTIIIPDFKDETVATYGLKYIADENGCKSGYLFSIKTIDDKFVGVLGVDYVKRKNKLTQEEINHISNYASSIGAYLIGNYNN